jgi:predicted metal-dependent HD superfamily phosphohydrolase
VTLAILFHDIIYDPTSGHNEEDSADFFLKFAKEIRLDDSLAQKVYKYIMATKKHTVQHSSDEDLKLFIDFDMAVLGRPRQCYEVYAGQIRKEYIHVEPLDYCKQRGAFLASMAENRLQPLYASVAFLDSHEEVARQNMAWEAAELDARRIPSALPAPR